MASYLRLAAFSFFIFQNNAGVAYSKLCLDDSVGRERLTGLFQSGLMPPVTESASEDGGADHEEEEEDYDTADDDDRNQETDQERLADIDDAVVGTSGTNVTNASRNDSVVHRSPSPSSACHSLEWDSNGDDFFATTVDHCRAGQVKPTVRPSAYQTPLDIWGTQTPKSETNNKNGMIFYSRVDAKRIARLEKKTKRSGPNNQRVVRCRWVFSEEEKNI